MGSGGSTQGHKQREASEMEEEKKEKKVDEGPERVEGKNDYVPKPRDTSAVVMPEHLTELTEKLAENAHDCWAEQRIAQGWTWGPERNDDKKHHPCLIPYDELSEEEKSYDRITAMNTLKLLLAFGYSIEPPAAS